VIIADKHTIPYYNGRTERFKEKLPGDLLLEADIYDVHVRDFAPIGLREFTQFKYVLVARQHVRLNIFV
jgi:hypothetical protein